jgi:hypothetical protein
MDGREKKNDQYPLDRYQCGPKGYLQMDHGADSRDPTPVGGKLQ